MEIRKSAVAGTLESSDAAVTVEPKAAGAGPSLELVVECPDSRFAGRVRATTTTSTRKAAVTRSCESRADSTPVSRIDLETVPLMANKVAAARYSK